MRRDRAWAVFEAARRVVEVLPEEGSPFEDLVRRTGLPRTLALDALGVLESAHLIEPWGIEPFYPSNDVLPLYGREMGP